MRMKSNEACTDIGANLRLNTLLTIFFIVFGLLISICVFESSLSLNNAYADSEICDNGVDEPEGDDLVDCADDECNGLQGPNGQTCQFDGEDTPHCDDGEDNDGDGLVDCADPDCLGEVAAPPVPGVPDGDVLCQTSENIDPMIGCDDGFDNDADGLIDCDDPDCEVEMGCNPEEGNPIETCSDGSDNDSDGLRDCADTLDCPPGVGLCESPPETTCDDGFNNDGNQGEDCLDPDCIGLTGSDGQVCERPEATLCNDGLDNDQDGLIDCADNIGIGMMGEPLALVSCQDPNGDNDTSDAVAPCGPEDSADTCGDGIDNDNDGSTDCADTGCPAGTGPCQADENTTAFCGDGIDNNNDGAIDCADTGCLDPSMDPPIVVAPCESDAESLCGDGIDNDGDGQADCADTADCPAGDVPECALTENNCADGVDNDTNGLTDCADVTQCTDQPGPGGSTCENPESTCDDGADNDGDGQADCADPDCDGVAGCEILESTCGDGVDNDNDGLTDCADANCGGEPGPDDTTCPENTESTCDDGEDNDGDGPVDCDDDDCDGNPACGSIPPTGDNLSQLADLSLCEFPGPGDGFCLSFTTTSNIEDVAISINIAEGGDIDLNEITTDGGEGAVCVEAEDADGDETILLVPDHDIVCTLDALNGVFEIQVAGCAEDQDGPLDLIVDLVSTQFPGQQFIGVEQLDTDFQCDDSDSCALVGSVSTGNLAGLALYALIPAAILVRRLRRKQS